MNKMLLAILLSCGFIVIYAQDTISFPQKITKFIKSDSLNVDTMYKRAYFYFAPHYKIVKIKKDKTEEILWMWAK